MWRPVAGYAGLYEISEQGAVRRKAGFWCRTDRPLVLHMSNTGYLRVSLSTRESRNPRKMLVHRMVYEAFVGPIPPGSTVNHCNGRKTDNRPENLGLATMSEQMHHAYATGLQVRTAGEARGRSAKLTECDVREIRHLYRPRVVTYKALAAQFGVSPACVLTIVRRLRWRHI
jgi:hypothetical protein